MTCQDLNTASGVDYNVLRGPAKQCSPITSSHNRPPLHSHQASHSGWSPNKPRIRTQTYKNQPRVCPSRDGKLPDHPGCRILGGLCLIGTDSPSPGPGSKETLFFFLSFWFLESREFEDCANATANATVLGRLRGALRYDELSTISAPSSSCSIDLPLLVAARFRRLFGHLARGATTSRPFPATLRGQISDINLSAFLRTWGEGWCLPPPALQATRKLLWHCWFVLSWARTVVLYQQPAWWPRVEHSAFQSCRPTQSFRCQGFNTVALAACHRTGYLPRYSGLYRVRIAWNQNT
jgi:hypothetical protein